MDSHVDDVHACRHCGGDIWRDPDLGPGWYGDGDDVCGDTLRRRHAPVERADQS